jgi:hypothetical protein
VALSDHFYSGREAARSFWKGIVFSNPTSEGPYGTEYLRPTNITPLSHIFNLRLLLVRADNDLGIVDCIIADRTYWNLE